MKLSLALAFISGYIATELSLTLGIIGLALAGFQMKGALFN
ncbi:MAG TPA: hypothetical protein VK108_00090 [Pseudogracilibacillus sp.]|nr:hypothetical protein [Pseudogracilibacillus sp.]